VALEHMSQIYWLIWIAVGLTLLASVNLLRSREGRAIRALRGGSVLVESLGIDSFRIKLALFVISALLAALAGWLYAHMQRFISPATFDLRTGIEFLLMAVLGGLRLCQRRTCRRSRSHAEQELAAGPVAARHDQ
jgi:branched-chain amino acid transport system permease protein